MQAKGKRNWQLIVFFVLWIPFFALMLLLNVRAERSKSARIKAMDEKTEKLKQVFEIIKPAGDKFEAEMDATNSIITKNLQQIKKQCRGQALLSEKCEKLWTEQAEALKRQDQAKKALSEAAHKALALFPPTPTPTPVSSK